MGTFEKGKFAVIFDFNGTIYDPDTQDILPGVRELLIDLQNRSIPMYLVSKADEGRPQLLNELGLESFFKDYFFVERKDPFLFFEILRRSDMHPKQMYVVGDHLHKEIRCGNQCGMRTVWLKRGKFSHLTPETETDTPWRTVAEMNMLLSLLE